MLIDHLSINHHLLGKPLHNVGHHCQFYILDISNEFLCEKSLHKFFVFTTDGVYPYHCEPHPWMQGKITILKQKF